MRKPPEPPIVGAGSVRLRREVRTIVYSISSPDQMKTGKGSISGPAAHVADAFSCRDVQLTLESGQLLDVSFLGHTAGSDTAYFEIRRRA